MRTPPHDLAAERAGALETTKMNPVSIPAPHCIQSETAQKAAKNCTIFVQSIAKYARSLHSVEGPKSGNATGMVRITKITQVHEMFMETLFDKAFRPVPLSIHKVFPASGRYHKGKIKLHNN